MERQKRCVADPQLQEDPESSKVEGDSGSQLDVLAKAHEFFQICDVERKGFIARHDMQRLHGELPLVPEELEKVFDTLDADGNGSLTLEEFTTGFSQFLSGRKEPFAEVCETGFHPKPKESVAAGNEEEEQFSNLMEQLGAENILKDENDVKKLWLHLKKHEPHLLSNFEEFLTKIFSQLHEADNEKNTLECALQNKMSAYDDEIQYLYEEMEQQIKTEKEKVLLEGAERFQSRQQELEQKLVEKEEEFEQLSQKQKTLDKQCKELRNVKYDTTTENTKLRVTNQELLNSLERTSEELIIAQQQLEILQDEAKKLQEEKEIEVCRVTEILEREKLGLLKQLDFLRERNKYLSDERDVCLQRKSGYEAPVSQKQRSGSIIGKYIERRSSLKSEPSEDETFSASQIRSSLSMNVDFSLDSEPPKPGGLTQRKQFRRLISIEEDHLPHLLNRTERQLIRWPEEDEDERGPDVNGVQQQSQVEQAHASPREEPIGKENLTNEEAFRMAPDRIFKIVLVGNSAVGKTSFLKQFCEERFYPGTAATVGVDYSMKTVNLDGSQVVLQLWDTAGQERYRSITKQFFRKADGVVVMYDVTAQHTFVAVKQWLVSVEEAAGENIPILLLGNKVDKEKEREVPKRLGEHLAKDYSIIFYECSALTGENIKVPILHLARILKEQEDNVKEKTVQLQQQPKKTICCSRQ
ncbi:EF-hand calcium-binding domain-containing protein 4B [Pseudonaja textilis]|uniref:Calcium release activated channel regulator 2A n=1 Tax=Pseudonaja textilis TaxID=8673 RepID=A0A670XMR6_PSETE|nr:EF-hand calcium-binding domain-containing protein 4B [Pseudonaja textilis]XP_026557694.1 EF-hand calcium-binding domain-containing protein 4B [Pseudonaja textilis]XP_026557702.1 EF-hand calcium-binding domain-containing protein 4B [Pseudonaja textilis]